MSRLDSAIRRLEAQRACLNRAAALIRDTPGIVLELGLGNGRTYDHLKELLPDRRIVVFERKAMAHPDSMPPAENLIEGDFRDTIPGVASKLGEQAALIHGDIGSGDKAATQALAEWLGPMLQPLAAPGCMIVSDQQLTLAGGDAFPLPGMVAEGRYHMLRLQS